MSQIDPDASAHDEGPLVSEEDKPDVRLILVLIVATVTSVIILVIFAYRVFGHLVKDEIQSKILDHPSSDLRELRAEEEGKLTHYQWADQKAGVVHIPLTRARELVLHDYQTVAGAPPVFVPSSAAQPAASASASAAVASSGSAGPSTSASSAPSTSVSAVPATSAAPAMSAHPAPRGSAPAPH